MTTQRLYKTIDDESNTQTLSQLRSRWALQVNCDTAQFAIQQPSSQVFEDNRSLTLPVTQRSNTGLSDNLKTGMENLSGMSLDHVNEHYNSSKPALVQARAYAQGSDIHYWYS